MNTAEAIQRPTTLNVRSGAANAQPTSITTARDRQQISPTQTGPASAMSVLLANAKVALNIVLHPFTPTTGSAGDMQMTPMPIGRPGGNHLIVIDPQNDFIAYPDDTLPTNPATGEKEQPALRVDGAHDDLKRVASLVKQFGHAINRITVTLDTHNVIDIGHASYWETRNGDAVAPFTPITAQEFGAGDYRTRHPSLQTYTAHYLKKLEQKGGGEKRTHMVWPTHCLEGSWGRSVHPFLQAELHDWVGQHGNGDPNMNIGYVTKGENAFVESYSALKAEVPARDDPRTHVKMEFIRSLAHQDTIYLCGQALTHCVYETVNDIVEGLARVFPNGGGPTVCLLTDCASPVAGFDKQEFLDKLADKGVQLLTAEQAGRRFQQSVERTSTDEASPLIEV